MIFVVMIPATVTLPFCNGDIVCTGELYCTASDDISCFSTIACYGDTTGTCVNDVGACDPSDPASDDTCLETALCAADDTVCPTYIECNYDD